MKDKDRFFLYLCQVFYPISFTSMKKNYPYFFFFLLVCFGCKNDTTTTNNSSTSATMTDTTALKTADRGAYSAALTELFDDFKSNDLERMKRHFQFPITDPDTKNFFWTESTEETDMGEAAYSEADFVKHYQTVTNPEIVWLGRMVGVLPLSELGQKNEVTKTVDAENSFCQYYYTTTLNENQQTITVSYGTDIKDGKEPQKDEDECGEFAHFWTFELKNGVLVLKKLMMAG